MGSDEKKVEIKNHHMVTFTKMNHIIEVQHMEKINRSINIRKIDSERYIDLETGEIKEFNHSENRSENKNSLRQTFKNLRYLINNNFIGASNELHVILTYRENMTDAKRLYVDFDKFIKRLRYRYKNKSSIDYLSVVEPQERGAWHCHVLMRFNDLDKVFIKNADMRALWGHGFVQIKAIKDVDNIGAYLSAYLTDIELTQENALKTALEQSEIVTREVEGQEKKFVKGGRLHLYPPGMNLYRNSRGIIKPERVNMEFSRVKKIVGSAKPHYEKKYHIENDNFENTISFQEYNMKRK